MIKKKKTREIRANNYLNQNSKKDQNMATGQLFWESDIPAFNSVTDPKD